MLIRFIMDKGKCVGLYIGCLINECNVCTKSCSASPHLCR